jgi:hypothetical protein
LRISAQIGLCDAKSGSVAQIIFMAFWPASRVLRNHVAGHARCGASQRRNDAAKKKR